ncbi:hypothetical protein ES707_19248 [subsurface metagenome]
MSFIREPNLAGDRLFKPLLKIAGIIDPYIFPLTLRLGSGLPRLFSRPIARRHENESGFVAVLLRESLHALIEIVRRLLFYVLVRAKFPARSTGWYPRCSFISFDDPVPAGSFSIVVSGKIHFRQAAASRVHERTKEYRKARARRDVPGGPFFDLVCFDAKQRGDVCFRLGY